MSINHCCILCLFPIHKPIFLLPVRCFLELVFILKYLRSDATFQQFLAVACNLNNCIPFISPGKKSTGSGSEPTSELGIYTGHTGH